MAGFRLRQRGSGILGPLIVACVQHNGVTLARK
jgi:hypothetical protein